MADELIYKPIDQQTTLQEGKHTAYISNIEVDENLVSIYTGLPYTRLTLSFMVDDTLLKRWYNYSPSKRGNLYKDLLKILKVTEIESYNIYDLIGLEVEIVTENRIGRAGIEYARVTEIL
jgi:hypothetical protein